MELGDFLEVSVATEDILRSYDFYLGLGFTGIEGSDVLGYRYGVVSDGTVAIGLHATDAPPLALTFVRDNLARHVGTLEALGLAPEDVQLGDHVFNRLSFPGPGIALRLVEARTYSPVGQVGESLLGRFDELRLPAHDPQESSGFFVNLGFAGTEEGDDCTVACGGLTVRLPLAGGLKRPALQFATRDVADLARRLERGGYRYRLTREGQSPGPSLELTAPEGTLLRVAVTP